MENKFEKLIKDVRSIKMSYDEKDAIRHRLKAAMGMHELGSKSFPESF